MKLLYLCLGAFFTICLLNSCRTEPPISLEFRLVQDTPKDEHSVGFKARKGGHLMYPISNTLLDQSDVASAVLKRVKFGEHEDFVVLLTLNLTGQAKLERLTAAHINERLGIFIDKELVAAPMIKDKISGGHISILGNFSEEEAENIVNRINALKR